MSGSGSESEDEVYESLTYWFPGLRVGDAGEKGRGVFSQRYFKVGALIERAPLILIHPEDNEGSWFVWEYLYELEEGWTALGLGLTSLYNHADDPNADYCLDEDDEIIEIVCRKQIVPGDEITIDYGWDPAEEEEKAEGERGQAND